MKVAAKEVAIRVTNALDTFEKWIEIWNDAYLAQAKIEII